MNSIQICLVLATCCSMLISAHSGSHSHHQILSAIRNLQSTPIISTVTPGPILSADCEPESSAPILRTVSYDTTRILAAAAPISLTASPTLETKLEAEPLVYAARSEFAPIPKYAPLRPEFLAANPAPLFTPRLQMQNAREKVLMSEPNLSYSPQDTSISYKSSVIRQQSPIKFDAPAAPQYYAAPSPILETKIEAEPLAYNARAEYLAASPAPQVAPRLQMLAIRPKIIMPEPIMQSYSPQATSFSYKSSVEHQPSPIKTVAPAAPQYYTAPSPILETKIQAEPQVYAARSEFTPIPKYAPLRAEYLTASPAPLVAPRWQMQATRPQINMPEPIMQSYSPQATSFSYKSSVEHQPSPIKIVTPAAPQYYAATSPVLETKIESEPLAYAARSEYLTASPAPLVAPRLQMLATRPKIIMPEPILQSYSPQATSFSYKSSVEHQQSPIKIIAPATPQYYAAPAMATPQYYAAPAPAAPIAQKMPLPVIRTQSSPGASSYQYAHQWDIDNEQPAANLQTRYAVQASPVYSSAAYMQPQQYKNFAAVTTPQVQFDDQEQPCEK